MTEPVEMLFRAFVLSANDRDALLADIDAALAKVNAQLGTTFTHDGSEAENGVTYTVWTDDPDGRAESSWLRLTDGQHSLVLEINATTAEILDATTHALLAAMPVVEQLERAPRPF